MERSHFTSKIVPNIVQLPPSPPSVTQPNVLGAKKHSPATWPTVSTLLLKESSEQPNILIDSGTADDFYKQGQLLPENFQKVAEEKGFKGVQVRLQDGYDHSYYFISSFAEDHVRFHGKFLKA